jgi:hypothetical protein
MVYLVIAINEEYLLLFLPPPIKVFCLSFKLCGLLCYTTFSILFPNFVTYDGYFLKLNFNYDFKHQIMIS